MAWVNFAIAIVSFIGLIFLVLIILLASTWNYYRNKTNPDGTPVRPSAAAKTWFWILLAIVILLTLSAIGMAIVGLVPHRTLPLALKMDDKGNPHCRRRRTRYSMAGYGDSGGGSMGMMVQKPPEPTVHKQNRRTIFGIISAIVALMGIALIFEMAYWYHEDGYFSPATTSPSSSSAFYL